MQSRGKWPYVKSLPVTLSASGIVLWGEKEVGVWWKDDVKRYRFAPSDKILTPVWAETQRDLRSAISANCNILFHGHIE
jgi:hypothetical protein